MDFILSHIWLPYIFTLALVVIALFFKLGCAEMLCCAALLNLVPVRGLWCIRSARMVSAVIIAVFCCALLVLAVLGLRKAVRSGDKKLIRGSVAVGLAAASGTVFCCFSSEGQVLQTVLTVCCIIGMMSAVYICWWLGELGKGMRSSG